MSDTEIGLTDLTEWVGRGNGIAVVRASEWAHIIPYDRGR